VRRREGAFGAPIRTGKFDPLDLFITFQLIRQGLPSLGKLLVLVLDPESSGFCAALVAFERLGATFLRGQWQCILPVCPRRQLPEFAR
jgi:hypothetical protein